MEEGWFDDEAAAAIEQEAVDAVEVAVEFGRASDFPAVGLADELTYAS